MLNKKIHWMQLSQRQRMSPFPNYMSMESTTKEMKKVIGYAYHEVVLIFKQNNFYAFMDKADHERVGKKILEKVISAPDMFVKLAVKQRKFAKSFYSFLNKNNNSIKLKKYNMNKLASLHEEYDRRYKEVYSHYFPVLSIEIYFFNYLRDYLYSREKNIQKAAKYLDILITERKAMVNRQEIIAALKVCSIIKRNKKWTACFKPKNPEKINSLLKSQKELYHLLKAHEKKFFWITRDYDDPVLTLDDFILKFKNLLKSDPVKKLKTLFNQDQKLSQEIKYICKKLKIDQKHQRLFQTMREGIYYKELRKSIVSQSLYFYDPILGEIARRSSLTIRQARHLKTMEVRPLLVKNIDMSQEMNDRIELSVFHAVEGRAKVYTLNGAKKYYDFLVKVDKKARVLLATPVSSGIARGPAKIVINPDAFHKVKKGDIIITLQATPVFSNVLLLAGGLICDGGPGITSHPATLAREAGIPGVIGARMATKIFKDGEMVEVDGNSGVVKKI